MGETMFWKKRRLDKEEEDRLIKYREYIKTAISNLNEGKINYLSIVYQALVSNDAEIIKLSSKSIKETMCHMNSMQIMKLDEQFRQYTSLEWYTDWEHISLYDLNENINNQEEYLSVIRLGTFHPNGFLERNVLLN